MDCVLLDDNCIPVKGYIDDAGYDLRCRIEKEIVLKPGDIETIPLGIKIEIPRGSFGLITGRSSSSNMGLLVMNGIIDCNYRGELKGTFINVSMETITIQPFARYAQLIIVKQDSTGYSLNFVPSLSETSRGGRGFGSSGM